MVDFAKLIQQNREKYNIENRPKTNLNISISVAGSDYAIRFGWDEKLKNALKEAIPPSEITWHKTQKVWLVSPGEIDKAIQAINQHTGQTITLPIEKPTIPQVMEKTFILEYLGATKDRGKTKSAYGSVNGQWASEFPEDVLLSFFEKRELGESLGGLQTLYQVLCVVESSTPEQIKSAYRRLARQWHPDVCREENATEMFRKIDEAYKTLSNPEQKKRYDAGLYFERQGYQEQSRVTTRNQYGYRSPLRCGQITAKGTVRLMRFVVQEILKWDDVTNREGKVMSSSWPKGAETFQVLWV
jgi:hypothetical protein